MRRACRIGQAGGLGLALLAGLASAQWREGLPPVLTPPPQPEAVVAPDAAAAFARAYGRLARPRTMLLWNRALSEETATQSVEELVSRDAYAVQGQRNAPLRRHPGLVVETAAEQGERTLTLTLQRRELAPRARAVRLAEWEQRMLEQAFMSALVRAGTRIVDPTLALRMAAAKQPGGDRQTLEIDALAADADMLLEILLVDDAQAPAGYGFDVRAKRVRGGQVLASGYFRAHPAPVVRASRWIAGPAGYELERAPDPVRAGPDEIGAALANEVMAMLASSP